MIEEIKLLLGDSAENYSDALIGLMLKQTIAEIEGYCRRELDYELETVAQRIVVIKLHRMGTEGLASTNFSGVGETYTDGYPSDIQAVLNRKRKIKVM
jgi:hypothetical protein